MRMDYARIIHGIYKKYASIMYGIRMDYARIVHGICIYIYIYIYIYA